MTDAIAKANRPSRLAVSVPQKNDNKNHYIRREKKEHNTIVQPFCHISFTSTYIILDLSSTHGTLSPCE